MAAGRTGDVAEMSPEGALRILARARDIVAMQGGELHQQQRLPVWQPAAVPLHLRLVSQLCKLSHADSMHSLSAPDALRRSSGCWRCTASCFHGRAPAACNLPDCAVWRAGQAVAVEALEMTLAKSQLIAQICIIASRCAQPPAAQLLLRLPSLRAQAPAAYAVRSAKTLLRTDTALDSGLCSGLSRLMSLLSADSAALDC